MKEKFFLFLCLFCSTIYFVQSQEVPVEKPLPESDEFVIYDFPRGGIYTIGTCLNLMTGRGMRFFPNNPVKSIEECANRIDSLKKAHQFETEHWFWDYHLAKWRSDLNCKIFFFIRDPRDVCIEFINFIMDGHDIGHLSRDNWFGELSIYDQVKAIINELHDSGISRQIRTRLGWMYMPNSCTIRFEALLGPDGGGNHLDQTNEIRKIANHINLNINENKIEIIANDLYHRTPENLRMGDIGMWKHFFTEENKELFKEKLGDVLIQLGYEKDLNW